MNDPPKNANGNGRRFSNWIGIVPFAVWGFLIVQFVTIAVWAIRLEGRVQSNAERVETIVRDGTSKDNANEIRLNNWIEREAAVEKRVDVLSNDGTVKTNILEQRLLSLTDRLAKAEQKQDEGARAINQLNLTKQQLDALNERTERLVQALDAQYNALNDHLR